MLRQDNEKDCANIAHTAENRKVWKCFRTFHKPVIANNATTDEFLETVSTTEESAVVEKDQ
jgi:hypothetical protein